MSVFRPRLFAALVAATLAPGMPGHAADSIAVRVPRHERFVLANGLTVILIPRREVPLVAFAALLRGGALADPRERAGLSSIVAGLLEKGAGERTAFQFADAVEGAGGSFTAAAGAESISVGGQFLARDRELMLELLADALMRPRLEAGEFGKLRDRQIELIKAAKDSDPSELIGIYGRALLFGAHPYGVPASGSERSLAAVGHDDVRSYWRDHFGADRTTLIFSGDIDSIWLREAVTRIFGSWPKARAPVPALPVPLPAKGRRVLLVDSPGSTQTYFWIGNLGVARRYPARAALDVVNTLYGGRFTSILNTKLRIESGLSYGASASFNRGSVPGEFSIRSFTQTENTTKALDLAIDTLASLHREGVPPEALDSGRSYVLGQYPLRLETAAHWAAAFSELELYGLDLAYIEGYGPAVQSVNAPQARAAIGEAYPRPEDLVFVLIGDAAKIRDQVARYGAVTEIPLTHPAFTPGS